MIKQCGRLFIFSPNDFKDFSSIYLNNLATICMNSGHFELACKYYTLEGDKVKGENTLRTSEEYKHNDIVTNQNRTE